MARRLVQRHGTRLQGGQTSSACARVERVNERRHVRLHALPGEAQPREGARVQPRIAIPSVQVGRHDLRTSPGAIGHNHCDQEREIDASLRTGLTRSAGAAALAVAVGPPTARAMGPRAHVMDTCERRPGVRDGALWAGGIEHHHGLSARVLEDGGEPLLVLRAAEVEHFCSPASKVGGQRGKELRAHPRGGRWSQELARVLDEHPAEARARELPGRGGGMGSRCHCPRGCGRSSEGRSALCKFLQLLACALGRLKPTPHAEPEAPRARARQTHRRPGGGKERVFGLARVYKALPAAATEARPFQSQFASHSAGITCGRSSSCCGLHLDHRLRKGPCRLQSFACIKPRTCNSYSGHEALSMVPFSLTMCSFVVRWLPQDGLRHDSLATVKASLGNGQLPRGEFHGSQALQLRRELSGFHEQ
mmetsp:Transcript_3653/g.10787  ORF Transcript_3653/g.10787 Transcript_3653/m.10787 type:complete len:421 (-) Transcript_3653:1724-2986(-)